MSISFVCLEEDLSLDLGTLALHCVLNWKVFRAIWVCGIADLILYDPCPNGVSTGCWHGERVVSSILTILVCMTE